MKGQFRKKLSEIFKSEPIKDFVNIYLNWKSWQLFIAGIVGLVVLLILPLAKLVGINIAFEWTPGQQIQSIAGKIYFVIYIFLISAAMFFIGISVFIYLDSKRNKK